MGSIYTLIPRPIYDFASQDALSRYTFGLLWDRWRLSCKTENIARFSDKFGTYCVYEREALAAEMGVTLPTVRRCINSLVNANLICARRTGVGATFRYYITRRAWDHMMNCDEWFLPLPSDEGTEEYKPPKFYEPKSPVD